MINFGEKLKELRTQAGLTQGKLAARLGVRTATVIAWEHDRNMPDVLVMADLADVFGCSINELVGKPRPYGLENIEQKPVGEIIREMREALGLSSELISHLLNVSRQTVSNWERGVRYPSIEDAAKLAKLFCCSINELVGRKVKK